MLITSLSPQGWTGAATTGSRVPVAPAAPAALRAPATPARRASALGQPAALASPLSISRVQSAYRAADAISGTLTLTFTVTNDRLPAIAPSAPPSSTVASTSTAAISGSLAALDLSHDPNVIHDALLTDALAGGAMFAAASPAPDRQVSQLAWNLGDIQPLHSVTATLTLRVPASSADFSTLDTGATVWGALQGRAVSARALAAGFAPDSIDPTYLRSTVDANTTDPYMLDQAAQVGQDPLKEFAYVQSLGYDSYTGSLRGTRGTLWSGAGNALDKSSLLIAMLRASGIPSRYRHGALGKTQAQQLILSMFPASTQTIGYVPPGAATSDPANDPKLLAETEDHWWVEAYLPGQGWTDLDPAFPGLSSGQTAPGVVVATDNTDRIAEVPDALRGKVTVSVKVESYSPLNFDDNGLSYSYPLTHTFDSAALTGEPVTLQHLVNSSSSGGGLFAAASSETTYVPYLVVGDPTNSVVIEGQPFQDVQSFLAFASQRTTAEWLEFDVQNVDGTTQHYERTVKDVIGVAGRQAGTIVPGTTSTQAPFISSDLSLSTLFAPGRVSLDALRHVVVAAQQGQQRLTDALANYNLALPGTAAQSAALRHLNAVTRAALRDAEFLQAMQFYVRYDMLVNVFGTRLLAHLYANSPRIVIASDTLAEQGVVSTTLALSLDLLHNADRIEVMPGQDISASFVANELSGVLNGVVESQVGASLGATDSSGSVPQVFDAVRAAGATFTLITPDTLDTLSALGLSHEAEARIAHVVADGKIVVVPTGMVAVNGSPTVGWYEIDPQSGATVDTMENGQHDFIEYILLLNATPGSGVGGAILAGKDVGNYVKAGALVAFTADVFVENKSAALQRVTSEVNNFTALIKYFYSYLVANSACSKEKGADFRKCLRGARIKFIRSYLQVIEDLFRTLRQLALGSVLATFITGRDPSLPALLANPEPIQPARTDTTRAITVAGSGGSAPAGATLTTNFARVSGNAAQSWQAGGQHAEQFGSLNAPSASVYDANGALLDTGASATTDGSTVALVQGAVTANVTGTGSLSYYPSALSSLAAGSAWDSYTAQLTSSSPYTIGLSGVPVTSTNGVHTGDLTLSVPGETDLSGAGATAAPNFADSTALTGTAADLAFGPATVTNGSLPFDASNGFALIGYSGPLSVSHGTGGTDSVHLGAGANYVALHTSPGSTTTDPQTPVTFQTVINASADDTYTTTVAAPDGWSAALDATGLATVTPAPNAQPGDYTVLVTAQSAAHPDVFVSATHTVTITPKQGMALTVTPDPLITVPYGPVDPNALPGDTNNGQLQLTGAAYTVDITNTSTSAHTFALSAAGLPDGWTLLSGATGTTTTLTLPAGGVGEVGLYISPTVGMLPSPGTVEPFTVHAQAVDASSLAQDAVQSFTVPAIAFSQVTAAPLAADSAPGGSTTVDVAVHNVGNVAGTFPLSVTLPISDWTAAITSPLALAPGQVVTQTVTIQTPDGTLGQDYPVQIAVPSNGYTQTATLDVHLASAAGAAANGAAQAVAQLFPSNIALPASLAQLGQAIDTLEAACAGATTLAPPGQGTCATDLRDRVVAAAQQVAAAAAAQSPQLATDALNGTTQALGADTAVGDVAADIAALQGEVTALQAQLTELAAHGAQATFDPGRRVVLRNGAAAFALHLANTGSLTTTYALTLTASDASVALSPTGPLHETLAPGAALTLPVTATASGLGSASLQADISSAAAPDLAPLHAQAGLTTLDAFLQLTEVRADPAFVEYGSGVPVTATARIANEANEPISGTARLRLLDAGGTTVYSATQPLQIGDALTPVDYALGTITTTDLLTGTYTLAVDVLDGNGQVIPRASAQTVLGVGQAVQATSAVSPTLVAPGDAVVTTTITTRLNPQALGGQTANARVRTRARTRTTSLAPSAPSGGTWGDASPQTPAKHRRVEIDAHGPSRQVTDPASSPPGRAQSLGTPALAGTGETPALPVRPRSVNAAIKVPTAVGRQAQAVAHNHGARLSPLPRTGRARWTVDPAARERGASQPRGGGEGGRAHAALSRAIQGLWRHTTSVSHGHRGHGARRLTHVATLPRYQAHALARTAVVGPQRLAYVRARAIVPGGLPDVPGGGAGTVVGGAIVTDTVWSASGSPYVITPCLQIANGAILTIVPGVVVKFVPGAAYNCAGGFDGSHASLLVDGTLIAAGTSAQPITFTSNNDTSAAAGGDTTAAGATVPGAPAGGDWGTILLRPDASGSSITNAAILYGQAVVDNNTAPALDHDSLISTTLGLQLYAGSGITITNESLTNLTIEGAGMNQYSGIDFNAPVQGITVTGNTLMMPADTNGVILQRGGRDVTISGNTIQTGSNGGVHSGGSLTNALISGNTIAPSALFTQTAGVDHYASSGVVVAGDTTGVTITGNTVRGEGTGPAASNGNRNGVQIYPNTAITGLTVSDNMLTDLGSNSYNGIVLYGNSNSPYTATLIATNTVTDTAGVYSGVYIYGLNTGVTVAANTLALGTASAAAPRSGVYVDYGYNAACGCYLSGSGLTITRNRLSFQNTASYEGVYVAGRTDRAALSGNSVELNGSDGGASGIALGGVALGATLSGNSVSDGAANQYTDGLVFYGDLDASLVAGNTVTNTLGAQSGLVFYGSAHADQIYDNRLFGDTAGGILFNPRASSGIDAAGTTVSYNVVAGGAAGVALNKLTPAPVLDHNTLAGATSATGVYLPGAGNVSGGLLLDHAAPRVTNSLIVGNSNGVYDAPNAGDSPTLTANDVFSNTAANYVNLSDPTGTGGNISADPLFTNPTMDDFTLQAGSPVRGAASDGSDMGALQSAAVARVQFAAVSPGLLTPADPTNATAAITYATSGPLTVTVVISGSDGTAYRVLQSAVPEGAGTHSQSWDGTDGSGDSAPSGAYTVSIQGADARGVVVSRFDRALTVADPSFAPVQATRVIRSGQVVTVIPSAALSPTLTTLTLCATSHTPALGSCDYALGSTSTPNVDGTWSVTITTPGNMQPANYDLFLAYDYSGARELGLHDLGRSDLVIPPVLSLYEAHPVPNPLLTTPNNVCPPTCAYYTSAGATSWDYYLNEPMTVSLAISDAAGAPVTTVRQYQPQLGNGTISWDGTVGGAAVPDGVYTTTLAAVDAAGANANIQYNGVTAAGAVSETVVDDALALSSPNSGGAVSGVLPVTLTVSPLISPLLSAGDCDALYLTSSGAPLQGAYVGCVSLSGGKLAGTIDTTGVANGSHALEAHFALRDLNSGRNDSYVYQLGVLTVGNALRFFSGPNASPNPFTPNGDGANDTWNVSFTPNATVTATLSITSPSGRAVTAITQSITGGQASTISWDGTDARGNVVPDAPNYQAALTLADGQGRVLTFTGFGNIAVAAHPFTLASPSSGATLTGTTTFSLTLSPVFAGANIYDYLPGGQFHRGPQLGVQPAGSAGTSGEIIAGALTSADGAVYTLTVNPPTVLENGRYDLYADFSYGGGARHEHYKLGTVIINHAPEVDNLMAAPNPVVATSAVAQFDAGSCANGSNDCGGTTLTYFDATALTATVTIRDATGAVVATPLAPTGQAPGPHSTFWNGARAGGSALPNGVYTATVGGPDAAGNVATSAITLGVVSQPATLQPVSGTVVSAATPFTTTFDPLLAGRITVQSFYAIPQPSSQPCSNLQYPIDAARRDDRTWTGTFDPQALNLTAGVTYSLVAVGTTTNYDGSKSASTCIPLGAYTIPVDTPPPTTAFTTTAGYTATVFAHGFSNSCGPNCGVGPIGMAFDASGNLYVANRDSDTLYRFGPDGGTASTATQVNKGPMGGPTGLTFSRDGQHLYATRYYNSDVVEISPTDGSVIRTVAGGQCNTLGGPLAIGVDPLSGDLLVTNSGFFDFCHFIARVSNYANGPGTVTTYATPGGSDGLTIGPDGTLYSETDGCATKIAGTNQPQPPAVTKLACVKTMDGIALATSNDPSKPPFLVTNDNDGTLTKVDLTAPYTQTVILQGGTRGDFVTVGPDGCLYATQSSTILKVTNADGSCSFVPFNNLSYIATVDHSVPITGVNVLTATLSPAPLSTTTSATDTRLRWQQRLNASAPITTDVFQSSLPDMQPGEVRQVANSTTITYTGGSAPGTLRLGPLYVTAAHLVALTPSTQTVELGGQAVYTVTLSNPTARALTLTPTVAGLPAGWASALAPVTLPAGGRVDVPLAVTVPANASGAASLGGHAFAVVVGTDSGGQDQAGALLTVNDKTFELALAPAVAFAADGAVVTYTAAITNDTTSDHSYTLTTNGLAPHVATLPPAVPVAAGRAITVAIPITVGSDLGPQPFTLQATDETGAAQSATAVLDALGDRRVAATLAPAHAEGGPGVPVRYTLALTNTGSLSDTYGFSVTLPAGWSSSLEANGQPVDALSLSPYVVNTATLDLLVTPALGATPGDDPITVTVQSRDDPAVRAVAGAIYQVSSYGVQVGVTPQQATLSPTDTGTWQVAVTNTGQLPDTYTLVPGGVISGTAHFAPATLALGPGQTGTATLTAGPLPGVLVHTYRFGVTAVSQSDPAIQNSDSAALTFSGYQGVQVALQPSSQTLTDTMETSYLMVITNTGNLDTEYTFTPGSTPGGLDLTPEISQLEIPAHMAAGILLRVRGHQAGTYTVSVDAASADGTASGSATASLVIGQDAGPTATPGPSTTPTTSPTTTATMSPTATATATMSPTVTATSNPSATATPPSLPTTTVSAGTPTATSTATPTATSTATPTATSTATPTATSTATPTATSTATPTATSTATPTSTATSTATPTATGTSTSTMTPTSTPTATGTASATSVPAPSATSVPVVLSGVPPSSTPVVALIAPATVRPASTPPAMTRGAPPVAATATRTAGTHGPRRPLHPTLRLNRPAVTIGARLCALGSGFLSGEPVAIAMNGVAVAQTTATSGGTFTACFVTPGSLVEGQNDVTATGARSRIPALASVEGQLRGSAFYLVGASTAGGNDTELDVLNPGRPAAFVTLRFYRPSGDSFVTSLSVPGRTRATLRLSRYLSGVRGFGLLARSERVIAVQMIVHRGRQAPYTSLGSGLLARQWYLAEGYTNLTFHETLCLLNPNARAAHVQAHLLPANGLHARTVSTLVGAARTQCLDVNRLYPHMALAAITTSDQPIAVERMLTFGDGGYGATGDTGTPLAATTWLFAEGATTHGAQTFLTVLNPGTRRARVTAVLTDTRGHVLGARTIVVDGLHRGTMRLNDTTHAAAFATTLTSDQPVVVERPFYLGNPNAGRVAATLVYGRNGGGRSWTFPAGDTTGGAREELLALNPNASPLRLRATFYLPGERMVTRLVTVAAGARATLDVRALLGGRGSVHGTQLVALDTQGFVAEQSIYNAAGTTAYGTAGLAQ